jgi:hypothetical protein
MPSSLFLPGLAGCPGVVLDAPELDADAQLLLYAVAVLAAEQGVARVDQLAAILGWNRSSVAMVVQTLMLRGYLGVALAKPLQWREVDA